MISNKLQLSIITPKEREKMVKKSALSIPDKPSQTGWTPEQFKQFIVKPLFDDYDSFYYYINRLTLESNEILLNVTTNLNNKLDKENDTANNLTINNLIIGEGSYVSTPKSDYNAVNKLYVDEKVKKQRQIKTVSSVPISSEWSIGDYAFVIKK